MARVSGRKVSVLLFFVSFSFGGSPYLLPSCYRYETLYYTVDGTHQGMLKSHRENQREHEDRPCALDPTRRKRDNYPSLPLRVVHSMFCFFLLVQFCTWRAFHQPARGPRVRTVTMELFGKSNWWARNDGENMIKLF